MNQSTNQTTKIALLLLAAGSSSRLGQPKQLLEYRGEILIRRMLKIAMKSGCAPIAVVLGANASLIEEKIWDLPVQSVHNKDWEHGMGKSLSVGVKALLEQTSSLDALLLMVVDQPFLSNSHLEKLITLFQKNNSVIVASQYGKTVGVPAIFPASLFGELIQLDGPKGAKPILNKYSSQITSIFFPKGHVDIDTPQDWQALQ